jgi:hypothetical protein
MFHKPAAADVAAATAGLVLFRACDAGTDFARDVDGRDLHMRFTRFSLIGAAVAVATMLSTSAMAQTPAPPAEQPPAQQAEMATIEGQLASVDAAAKTIVVKTAAGKDESLRYDDSTKVVGGQSGVAGLANSKGTDVVVKFRGTGNNRVATEITIREKKS